MRGEKKMEKILYPLFVILGGVVITLITGKLRKSDISRGIGIASLLTSIVLLGVYNPFTGVAIFRDLIILDTFGGFFVFLFLGLAIAMLIGSMKLLDEHPEMVALVLLATLGMAALSISNDLITLFVAWEIMSLSTYVLTGLGRKKASTEAAMKYFIYGAVSSALVLFAISLVYGLTGTTNIGLLGPALASLDATALGVIALAATIFVFGFGYKMGMVPFHLWLPDVYEGAPPPVSGFLAGVAKKVAIVAAARIFLAAMVQVTFAWELIFAILAVITMTIGNVAALAQKSVIRMLAYSSISQVGYILIGFSVLTSEGLAASMMQITMHAVTTIGAFITVGIILYRHNLKTYDDYKGLGRNNPVIATGLAIMMLSLAGIPPLGGFVSKLFLFRSAVNGGMLWLAIIGVLNSVLSLGYYLPLIRNMYLEKSDKIEKIVSPQEIRCLGPWTINIVVALALFILSAFSQKLLELITQAAGTLLT